MNKKRRETTYLLRIWQEPSDLAPPGEWRGVLRSLDGRQERLFKSAQELWELLIHSGVPNQTKAPSSQENRNIDQLGEG